MACEDASHPSVTIDLHAELGPSRQRQRTKTVSRNEKRRADAKFFFNKIIASHYRDKSKEYSDVASLFVTWEKNDLLLRQKNNVVDQLSSIFEADLGYKTDAFQIPPEKPETALNAKVSDFVHKHDDPNALLVLYYAGHGFEAGEDEEYGLKIAAIEEGNGRYGDPQAFFPDVMRLLHVAHADVLLIVDCCYAARAFSRQRHGKRKFELLASSLEKAPAPGQPGSFTAALIKVLKRLFKEPEYKNGVSTSILYRELYHTPELPTFKPLLFDQSQFDYGKIWLRPRVPSSAPVDTTACPDATLDLRLHLSLDRYELKNENRVGLAMNHLARALQYLPDVHLIDFLELNAGDAEVEMFLKASRRITMVKKVIRILRNHVKETKKRKLEAEATDPKRPLPRPPSFAEHLLKTSPSATQDWSRGVAQFSNGTAVAVKPGATIHSHKEDINNPHSHLHQRRRTFWIPGIVYLSYILDWTGMWYAVTQFFGPQIDEDSKVFHKQTDGSPARRPSSSSVDTSLAREWKHHRFKRMWPGERIFWVFLVIVAYYL